MSADATALAGRARGTRILVVEDEAIVARDIMAQLREMGYEPVGQTALGEQVVELAARLGAELVLMDIQLRGPMDGIGAARAVRDQLGLPVVFLTAFASDGVLERAKLSEPYGYVIKPFSERELYATLEMALYKHQTEAELSRNALQLQALSRRVIEVQESERRRVALELHDELGQALTAVKINLQSHARFPDQSPAALLADSVLIVEQSLQQVRRIALALRPSMLDDLGLAPALRWLGEQSAARHGLEIGFTVCSPELRFAPEVETACFRIVQEALTNVARHARASSVQIALRHHLDVLTLSVEDDGAGFDAGALRAGPGATAGIGLFGMRERATLLGGQLEIRAAAGQGCTLRLRLPCVRRAPQP
jgi:signal transduction histidine kinase